MKAYAKIGLIVAGITIGLIALFILFWFIMGMTIGIGPGLGDWSLKLPNNYEMWYISKQDIRIGYRDNSMLKTSDDKGRMIGIPGNVIEFCSNDRYVGAKQVDIQTENTYYYLLDTLEQNIDGPYSNESQFNNICSEMNVSGLSKWEKTTPAPKNAIYGRNT
jgi:hypothetical protein